MQSGVVAVVKLSTVLCDIPVRVLHSTCGAAVTGIVPRCAPLLPRASDYERDSRVSRAQEVVV